MKLLPLVALLIGVLFAPLIVCADENATQVHDSETAAITEDPGNISANSADLALLFGKVHSTLLMATEEAFGYLLMDDKAEKQAYYDEIASSEMSLAAFEDAAAKAGENKSVLVAGYEDTMAAYANMTAAADAMFASYEKEGKPVMEDVVLFEESVDAVFNATDKTWTEYRSGNNVPLTVNTSVRRLYGQLLSAAEESYAYPVLGEKAEKEDALASFADFDTLVAEYEEKYPDTSFDELKVVKEEIQKAVETMFATYEKDGKVNGEEAAALEILVEKMNTDSLNQFGQNSSGEVPVAEETPWVTETTVNETAVNETAVNSTA